ncbi:MAG: hypothetical protein FJW40_24520, partial [Acidobacteria bacterium]|nr:hypothetical protein [Acidobacteriota bacterium]
LIERAVMNSSKKGDIVLDLFGGSGSTLIAAERMGRNARLMELDPRYVDVICRRLAQTQQGRCGAHQQHGVDKQPAVTPVDQAALLRQKRDSAQNQRQRPGGKMDRQQQVRQ